MHRTVSPTAFTRHLIAFQLLIFAYLSLSVARNVMLLTSTYSTLLKLLSQSTYPRHNRYSTLIVRYTALQYNCLMKLMLSYYCRIHFSISLILSLLLVQILFLSMFILSSRRRAYRFLSLSYPPPASPPDATPLNTCAC